jgi:hypothetical protein
MRRNQRMLIETAGLIETGIVSHIRDSLAPDI